MSHKSGMGSLTLDLNSLQPGVAFNIETSLLFCKVKQNRAEMGQTFLLNIRLFLVQYLKM